VGNLLSTFAAGFDFHANSDAVAWIVAGAVAGAVCGLAVGTGNPLLLGAGLGLVSYLLVDAATGKTPTWQGGATALVAGAVAVGGFELATLIVGESLGATLLSGAVVGAFVGGASEWFNNTLNGKSTTSSQVEGAAAIGAIFGLAGGLGEYGVSERSGGLGFGRPAEDDLDAIKAGFDLIVGTLAAASGNDPRL
jgi:hypothetical protein